MNVTTVEQDRLKRQVVKDLDRDEGFREFAYPDPLSALFKKFPNLPWGFKPAREIAPPGIVWASGGPWTVGFGFTHGTTPDSRMNRTTAERLLETHVLAMDALLAQKLPTWYPLAMFVTKTVLINMAFNMGVAGLLKFKNTLQYIRTRKYAQAAAGMRHSLWYKQVGRRAEYLARRIETQTIEPAHKAPERI